LCPVAADLEEPSAVSGEGVAVGEERVRETIGRGGSRGSRRRVLVTIEVQTLGPCRTREEPTGSGDDGDVQGNHRETGEVREEATPSSEPQTS
jgi:hypothetical protein